MVNVKTLVLWSNNGALQSSIYCSNPDAFICERVDDQMGMIAVKVTCTDAFGENDYLIRQVSKNGGVETQLIFGEMPKWAGGTLAASRNLLDSGSEATRLLEKFVPVSVFDHETRRLNDAPFTASVCTVD